MAFVAGAAIVCSIFLYLFAGVWLYDSNIDIFENVLNDHQRQAIIWSSKRLIMPLILLLIVTNVAWLAGVGVSLFRTQKDAG